MAKTLYIRQRTNSSSIGANGYVSLYNSFSTSAGETLMSTKIGSAGVFGSLGVQITSNATTGTTDFQFRKSGAFGNQVVSVPAGTSGWFYDTSNTDSISAGDTVAVRVNWGTGGTISLAGLYAEFSASSDTVTTIAITGSTGASQTNTGTMYSTFSSFVGTEITCQYKALGSGVIKNLICYVNANTNTASCDVRVRVNGANGNGLITIPATTTGWFQDSSNTDSFSTGDLLSVSYQGVVSTKSITFCTRTVEIVSTSNETFYGFCGQASTMSSTTRYYGMNFVSDLNTETNLPLPVQTATTITGLALYLSANSASSGTLTLRKNGADTAFTLTCTGGATGWFTNTGSIAYAVGDTISLKFVRGGATTTVESISVIGNVAGATVSEEVFAYFF